LNNSFKIYKFLNTELRYLYMSIPIDWAEISKSKKGVRTIDNKACGIVVSSAYDKMWIVDGAVNLKKYSG
jgi:hypothetical protein